MILKNPNFPPSILRNVNWPSQEVCQDFFATSHNLHKTQINIPLSARTLCTFSGPSQQIGEDAVS